MKLAVVFLQSTIVKLMNASLGEVDFLHITFYLETVRNVYVKTIN